MKKISEIQNRKLLFHLLDVSLNDARIDTNEINSLTDQDWESLFSLANHHEVAALLSDAIINNPSVIIPIDVRLKFIGTQDIAEQAYKYHINIMTELLEFFNRVELPTMIIKGLSLVKYYPIPSHRKCGDIDIYQYGQQQKSDQIIAQSLGLEIMDNAVGHHSVYQYKGIGIENHYHFITTYFGGKSLELEELLEEKARDSNRFELNKQGVFLPSPTFNAIFLPYHMACHFRSEKVTMRQIIDWMLFLKAEYDNVDWKQVYTIYKSFHLLDFVNAVNGILISYFHMSAKIVSFYVKNEYLEEKLFNDMMAPTLEKSGVEKRIVRMWFKYFKNGWKYRMFGRVGFVVLIKKIWAYLRGDDNTVVIYESEE